MLLVDLGSPDLGLPKVHDAYEAADRMGDAVLRAWVRLFLGHCYFAKGELDTAIEYLESCVAIRRRFHLKADFLSNRVDPLLARAYVESARRTSDPSVRRELLRRAGRHAAEGMRSMKRRATYRATALLALAECRWEEGKEANARALFDRAIACAEQQGSRLMLADAHYELGRRERGSDEARRHLQIALELYDACEAAPYDQEVRRALASIAASQR
jgi:tetratricopeptide (TPR) repeat protein